VLKFYKEQLAKVRQRLADASIEAPVEARRPSGDLDAELDNLSDLAGARMFAVSLLLYCTSWLQCWHLYLRM
jgi:hypothetical protein